MRPEHARYGLRASRGSEPRPSVWGAAPRQDSLAQHRRPKMSTKGWRPISAPQMRPEPVRHSLRAGRGPKLRVPGDVTRLPR
ncbi:hypothetical protein NDU88_001364 [Pleurodeles waltl]|uniref:Uncharacterized protein n=1 Tax=Pleurodeles waltl TaxID=8319 RepID=A0AAV7SZD7_PLEWA|nr:hypothetical protein NDU88_001364 [Pleurodeles waltl]